MDWKESYVLGQVPMDETHQDFVKQVTLLAAAEGRDAVLQELDRLVEHTIEHFEQENRWMEECGFPPIHCHQGEHERVLQSLKDMRPNIQADPGIARILANELESWFGLHASTMDDALAFFMRQVNYVPTFGSGKQ
jgi:hemerythrin